MLSTQKTQNLNPMRTWQRRLKQQHSVAAATAQTFEIDIPRDHFIHEIQITEYEHTSVDTRDPTKLVDVATDLLTVNLVANGNKILKLGTGSMFKEYMKLNKRKGIAGLLTLFFSDPSIPDAKPLPAWIFTSLVLQLTDNAPAGGAFHTFEVVLTESAWQDEDLNAWRVLVQKTGKWQKFGTNTGEQDYELERAYKIFGYLFACDDNGTLNATIYDLIKLLGRNPKGEITIVDVPVTLLKAENDSEIGIDTLNTGYLALQWKDGFPASEFSNLYAKPNILVAGTNAGLRILETYLL